MTCSGLLGLAIGHGVSREPREQNQKPLDDPAKLDEAFRQSEAEVNADPGLVAPDWTLYALSADTVEFWQADHQRRHVRLQYQRADGGWSSRLLWP